MSSTSRHLRLGIASLAAAAILLAACPSTTVSSGPTGPSGQLGKKPTTTKPNIRVDICSKCHPFFTGKQKFVDSAGRVEKFMKKYKKKEQ